MVLKASLWLHEFLEWHHWLFLDGGHECLVPQNPLHTVPMLVMVGILQQPVNVVTRQMTPRPCTGSEIYIYSISNIWNGSNALFFHMCFFWVYWAFWNMYWEDTLTFTLTIHEFWFEFILLSIKFKLLNLHVNVYPTCFII